MERIMRWCVPDHALRGWSRRLVPTSAPLSAPTGIARADIGLGGVDETAAVGREYTAAELNRNYNEAHGWR